MKLIAIDDADPGRRVSRAPAAPTRTGAAGSSAAAGPRHHDDEEGLALPDLDVRARGRVAARTQDLGDLGAVLAAPRRGRSGLPRHQRPAQVRALDHAQGPDLAEHPRDRRRRRGGDARAQGEARARAPGPRQRRAAPVAARARPRRRAQPADLPRRRRRRASALPGARPDARAGAGRVAVDAVRRDAPDLSTGRAGDLRRPPGSDARLARAPTKEVSTDGEDRRGDHDVGGRLHHRPGRRPGQGTRRRRGAPALLGLGRPLELRERAAGRTRRRGRRVPRTR